jgi:hypothetical protein
MQNISLRQALWAEVGLFGCPGSASEILKAAGIKLAAVMFVFGLFKAFYQATTNWSLNTGEAL